MKQKASTLIINCRKSCVNKNVDKMSTKKKYEKTSFEESLKFSRFFSLDESLGSEDDERTVDNGLFIAPSGLRHTSFYKKRPGVLKAPSQEKGGVANVYSSL